MVQSLTLPYKPDHVADSNFHSSGSDIDLIIMSLRSHDWYKQNPALDSLESRRTRDFYNSSLFLLGRNILQAAMGHSGKASKIIEGLDNWLYLVFIDSFFGAVLQLFNGGFMAEAGIVHTSFNSPVMAYPSGQVHISAIMWLAYISC